MGEFEGFVALLITAAVATAVARLIRSSSTMVLLLLGLGLGLLDLVPTPAPSSDVILLLFLPPLLFEAAFVLDVRLLWDVRTGVLVFAFPGVVVAMAVGGALVHWGLGLPWMIALLFGAMIAATDPVAVLATFRQLNVDRRLAALLEGESLLNDGVALALLVTFVNAVDGGFSLRSAAGMFLLGVIGGAVIGVVLGCVGHLLIARLDEHLPEMTVSVALAYGAFLSADHLHLSGVLATIAAAVTLGHLGRTRGWVYSGGSEELLTDLWAFLAFVTNAALFLLIGLEIQTADLRAHPAAIAWGVAAALVGRALVAYGLGALLTRLGWVVTRVERHVLFWGGLRGAVALAAALSLSPDFPHRTQLLAMTYGAVLFTLVVQGLSIGPLIRRLGLEQSV